jgi:prevent-host-death family protein
MRPVDGSAGNSRRNRPQYGLLCSIVVHKVATVGLMGREVSVRELRNHTVDVIAAVRAGERLSLTVNREPVADIVPHQATRSPWVHSSTLRRIVAEAGADAGLLDDLAEVRNAPIDEP